MSKKEDGGRNKVILNITTRNGFINLDFIHELYIHNCIIIDILKSARARVCNEQFLYVK